jgi:hypothetical protein
MVLPALGGAAPPDSIRPGYWSTTNSILKPVTRKPKTENRCITPTAITKFMGCYINHHYKCTCPDESTGGGRIVFHGDCVDAKGQHVLIRGEGGYTATTLQLSAEGEFPWMGMKIPFSTHTDSHWLADVCPPGVPGSDGR